MISEFESQQITTDLEKAGFIVPSEIVIPRLFICSNAHQKRGKTHWAVHSPDPIGVVTFDPGTEQIVSKAKREGYKIWLRTHRILEKSEGGSKDVWQAEWTAAKKSILTIIRNKLMRTMVIDTGDSAWELCRLANFGESAPRLSMDKRTAEWGKVNSEFRALVLEGYEERKDLNMIWIHKNKKEYRQNQKGDDSWSGKYERSGFGDMPYMADCNIEHYFDSETKEFGIRVLDCRENMQTVVGMELQGILCSFTELALQVFPETREKYWTGR